MKKNSIIVILLFLVLVLGSYIVLNSTKTNTNKSNNIKKEDKEKKYLLKKLTDSVDDNIEFYDEFEIYDEGYVFVYRNINDESKVVIFNKEGKDITDSIYDTKKYTNPSFRTISESIFCIDLTSDESIVLNSKLKVILNLNDEVVSSWFNKKYLVVYNEINNERLYGVYDTSGKKVIDTEYEYIREVEGSNYLLAEKSGKTGIIDISGNVVVPFEYDKFQSRYVYLSAGPIGKDLKSFLVSKNGIQRVVNVTNKEILVAESTNEVIRYDENLDVYYLIKYINGKENSIKFYKTNGNFIKEINLNNEYEIRNTIYDNDKKLITLVDKDQNTYEINKSFELVNKGKIYCNNDMNVYYCHTGKGITAKVNSNNKYEIYDNKNNKVLDYEFVSLRYDEDYIYGCLDEKGDNETKCGYFDYNGNILYSFKYDNESLEKVFELSDKTLYSASLKNIKAKTNIKYNYNYYMPIKDYVLVDIDNNRYIYDLDGNVIYKNCFNASGIMNDNILYVEYRNQDNTYSSKLYDANNINIQLFKDIELKKEVYNENHKLIYYGLNGIYELVFE